MVTKTEAELAEMTPEAIKAHFDAEMKLVFGENARRNNKGIPQEQGIGSPGRETPNHFAAMRKREAEGYEPEGTTDCLILEARERAKTKVT